MPHFSIDKCTENYNIRIPEITKQYLDKLSPKLKQKLKDRILDAMDMTIHEGQYEPGKYLKSEDI